jgi:adenosylcobyric acid synthase
MARAFMVQGTGSSVGKSLLVAGLARLFSRRGLAVRPFKPQNMSNNAAVTADGGEIGRAQALQARAAGVAASVHMNPVLLKPQGETSAQIVVQGKVAGTANGHDYQAWRTRLMPTVLDSFARLKREADLVIVEGAGAASEVNLRAGDIANMGFARATGTPVTIVGDISRGGVIASLVGTKAVIDNADAALIRGFIVNRFQGDPNLFADGMRLIAERTGWPALGLVPHFADAARLPAEDSLGLAGGEVSARSGETSKRARKIVVPVTPSIANFDDLDPLRQEPDVVVELVERGRPLPIDADLILLAGSKATINDLLFLRAEGWDIDLKAHVRRGGRVLGICGGYQMLGRSIDDPLGIEGAPRSIDGLGLLDVATTMTATKRLQAVVGVSLPDEVPFRGYEMHVGKTVGPATMNPLLRLSDGRDDGAMSADGRVAGAYIHGLFADDRQRARWLALLGGCARDFSYEATIEDTLDGLAEHLDRHIDCDRLLALSGSDG